jgi:hypothetical protein
VAEQYEPIPPETPPAAPREPPAPGPGATERPQLGQAIDLSVKAGAVALGFFYVVGFLIVTLHHAQFGIATFDLLRPRMFAAGTAWVVLTAVPAVFALRTFRFGGLAKQLGIGISAEPANKAPQKVLLALGLVPTVYGLAVPFAAFMALRQPVNTFPLKLILPILVGLPPALLMRRFFNRYPWLSCALEAALAVWFVVIAVREADPALVSLAGWFYVVALAAVAAPAVLAPSRFRSLWEWERSIPLLLILLAMYSTQVYSRIRFQFGGGAPVPITLHFVEPVPPFSPPGGDRIDATVYLVDENAEGYFVVRSPAARQAVFVRRDLVISVEYQPNEGQSNPR